MYDTTSKDGRAEKTSFLAHNISSLCSLLSIKKKIKPTFKREAAFLHHRHQKFNMKKQPWAFIKNISGTLILCSKNELFTIFDTFGFEVYSENVLKLSNVDVQLVIFFIHLSV